ncbi:MAG: glycosyltransferase family 4 protein [Alphaproteobacteria bacterium]
MSNRQEQRRVLIVVQNLPVPFDRRVWLEATSLQKAGYEVSVICPKAKGFNAGYEQLEGVHIHRYALPFDAGGALGFAAEFIWCFLFTALKSVKVAATTGFDVLHACNPPETYWLLAWLWRPFGKRFLFDHHDLSPEMYAAKFEQPSGVLLSCLHWLERRTFKAADVVITTNQSHKRIAVERGGMAPELVHIVRSGPDLNRLKRYPPDPSWKRGRRHLAVYLGEMCKQDGVDYMLRAIDILKRKVARDDLFTVFVGGGPHQQAIRDYAAELGLEDDVHFTGRVSDEDLCRILSSADLAVDPDPKTPWSDKSTMNKIIEYMYFGLPIACFDLAEHRVSAADAALYAEPNLETALADKMAVLLDDADLRRRMGEVGMRRVEEQLAWSYSEPVLLRAYDDVFAPGALGAMESAKLKS